MGSQFNFNFPAASPLAHQSSVYSLTFDELQNAWGGGKDFGSMNMDDLLKNVCTAGETSTIGLGSGGNNLQRQGSLTLPRTLSQKTVDEVWKDFIRENSARNGTSGAPARPPEDCRLPERPPERQPTLGEMTLEDFLLKAGVVKEDDNPNKEFGRPSNVGFFGESAHLNSESSGLALGFQPSNSNNINNNNNNNNNNSSSSSSFVSNQASNLELNVGGIQPMHRSRIQQPVLFPKPAGGNVAFASPRVRSSAGGVTIASPGSKISPDVLSRSDADTSSVSPVPYAFTRGRRPNTALEKVVERRQKRMLKNRESAARSRARKQAYTLELEAEVAKLKELNEELERKQAELMQMQQNQCQEKMKHQWGGKRLCLRRTLTGPW